MHSENADGYSGLRGIVVVRHPRLRRRYRSTGTGTGAAIRQRLDLIDYVRPGRVQLQPAYRGRATGTLLVLNTSLPASQPASWHLSGFAWICAGCSSRFRFRLHMLQGELDDRHSPMPCVASLLARHRHRVRLFLTQAPVELVKRLTFLPWALVGLPGPECRSWP